MKTDDDEPSSSQSTLSKEWILEEKDNIPQIKCSTDTPSIDTLVKRRLGNSSKPLRIFEEMVMADFWEMIVIEINHYRY